MQIELKNNELAILTLVVKGMEDIEIAKILSLEENKVKETIQTLKQKTKQTRRIDLSIYAVKNSLVCY